MIEPWRIWHRLFGWDYVLLSWEFGGSTQVWVVRRVRTVGNREYVRPTPYEWVWLESPGLWKVERLT